MDKVADSGEEIVITKQDKPVAKLTPYRERPKNCLESTATGMKFMAT